MDRKKLTAHLQGEQEETIGLQVLDAAELTWTTNRPQVTDFYDPYEQRVAKSVLGGVPEVGVLTFGGYRQAERGRLVVYPEFFRTETIENPIKVIEAKGNFGFTEVSHRDYLGSLMSLGIKREKLGDVVCFEGGCHAIVASETASYLLAQWDRVNQVPVEVTEIDQEQIAVAPERVKEISSTVASMRLDAIAAAGFGTSRTKMAREVKSERVKVNWQSVTNPAHSVEQGDVLSIRGRGRVVVEDVRGETRKGRIRLLLKRLI